MGNRSLEQAFNTVYHNKGNFVDFCSFHPTDDVEEFSIKGRTVLRTSKKFKSYLRFIDSVFLRHIAHNRDVVHSYIKEKSALTAVQAHAGNRVFFLSDIKSFFSKIREDDVKRVLERNMSLIPISDIADYIERLSHLTTWNDSLPVGFPTSPKLSNGFLFDFDRELQKICKNEKLVYTRYSDDIIISGVEKSKLTNLRERVQDLLIRYASPALRLNPDKTRITHIGNKVKILGLVITPDGRVTIDSKYKKNIEILLHFYTTDKTKYSDFLTKIFKREREKERSLFGILHYAKSCDPEYIKKLQQKYGVLALRTLMEEKWSDKI